MPLPDAAPQAPRPGAVTRFAPSPTGHLHLGHVHAAQFAQRRAAGGRYLVRLEDIDPSRCRAEFATSILQDLVWLGLCGEGEVRVQSAHAQEYGAALAQLRAAGLVYPCFCSRAEILREIAQSPAAPHDPDGAPLYPGTCRDLPAPAAAERLAAGQPHAWRLDMARSCRRAGPLSLFEEGVGRRPARPEQFGDVVLGRRDFPGSYHLCATHDDARQGVDVVTRAIDLRPAADLHRLLQALFGWPEPAYAHHALLRDGQGRRLAKRDQAVSVAALRAQGMTAAEVRAEAARLAGACA